MTLAIDKKISDLGAASALTGAELVELVQSGVNKKETIANILKLFLETFETFADIATTVPKLILVETDETNADEPTLYFFDGTNLNWIPMVGV